MTESVLNTQYGGEHYKGKVIQPIEYAHANNLSFFQGNVVKYVTRYKDKKGAEDIEKAVHYLQMILEFEYGVKTSFKKEEDISEQECVDYHQKLWKEGTIQPQSEVEQEEPRKQKLWCETCEGVGHYDNRGLGVPREYRNSECPCPDCDGKGYFEV